MTLIGMLPSLDEGDWFRFMFCTVTKAKWLAVCMVSAEMLNCKLLSTRAAGMKALYFTWCGGNH